MANHYVKSDLWHVLNPNDATKTLCAKTVADLPAPPANVRDVPKICPTCKTDANLPHV